MSKNGWRKAEEEKEEDIEHPEAKEDSYMCLRKGIFLEKQTKKFG